jgi:hypothetical protein
VNPVIEVAHIGAHAVIVAAAIGFGAAAIGVVGAVFGARIGINSAKEISAATLKSASDDVQAQIDAGSANIRAQLEAGSADIRVQIEGAQKQRLWEKRAELYGEILAAIHHRDVKREFDTNTGELSGPALEGIKSYLATYKPPDWYALEGRSLALSSKPVVYAVQLSGLAQDLTIRAANAWHAAGGFHGAPPELREKIRSARARANQLDNEAVELIRAELQGHGEPLENFDLFGLNDEELERVVGVQPDA